MDKKKNRGTTKVNLYIRIVAAAYIVYLAYTLFQDNATNMAVKNYWLIMGCAALFFVCGLTILLLSIIRLIKKEYDDPNAEEDAEQIVEGQIIEESVSKTVDDSSEQKQEESLKE